MLTSTDSQLTTRLGRRPAPASVQSLRSFEGTLEQGIAIVGSASEDPPVDRNGGAGDERRAFTREDRDEVPERLWIADRTMYYR